MDNEWKIENGKRKTIYKSLIHSFTHSLIHLILSRFLDFSKEFRHHLSDGFAVERFGNIAREADAQQPVLVAD